MSKNLSLDIKTTYQVGLIVCGLIAGLLIVANCLNVIQLFNKPLNQSSAKIREQQLLHAIQIVQTGSLEN